MTLTDDAVDSLAPCTRGRTQRSIVLNVGPPPTTLRFVDRFHRRNVFHNSRPVSTSWPPSDVSSPYVPRSRETAAFHTETPQSRFVGDAREFALVVSLRASAVLYSSFRTRNSSKVTTRRTAGRRSCHMDIGKNGPFNVSKFDLGQLTKDVWYVSSIFTCIYVYMICFLWQILRSDLQRCRQISHRSPGRFATMERPYRTRAARLLFVWVSLALCSASENVPWGCRRVARPTLRIVTYNNFVQEFIYIYLCIFYFFATNCRSEQWNC